MTVNEIAVDENGIKLVCATCAVTNEELAARPQVPNKRPLKLRICSGCMGVYYCGVQCQKQQWEAHREQCNKIQKEREQNPYESQNQ